MKKKSRSKIDRSVECHSIHGELVKLKVFPVEDDTSYIVIKSSQETRDIDYIFKDVDSYLLRRGFKKQVNANSSVLYRNTYGLDIFYGKLNSNHKNKAYKIQARGTFLIYKNAHTIIKNIVEDIKAIALKKKKPILLNIGHTRVDPSMLIIASKWQDILPEPKDNILNASSMKSNYIWSKTKQAVGIVYSNSNFRLKVYDKEQEIIDNKKKHAGDYISHYMKYVNIAKKEGQKLFRLELTNLHEPHLFEYDKVFLSSSCTEKKLQQALEEMLSRFSVYHAFKQVPKNQVDKLDKRNIGRWKIDTISGILLFDKRIRKGSVEARKTEQKESFKYGTHKPKKIISFEEAEKMYIRALLRIDAGLSREQLRFLLKNAQDRYYREQSIKAKGLREDISNQTRFRLSIATSIEEVDLILKEKSMLLRKININEHPGFIEALNKSADRARKRIKGTDVDD